MRQGKFKGRIEANSARPDPCHNRLQISAQGSIPGFDATAMILNLRQKRKRQTFINIFSIPS
jgi:hypothetical protein